MVSISGMLLFSKKPPWSTNSDSVVMSAPLCTFDSLSFCLHIDLLVSMENLMLSISIDRSLFVKALFINWCSIHQSFVHQLVFYPSKLCSSTNVLDSSCAFYFINQVDNNNVSTSCISVLCLRIFTIWHSTCTYPLILLFIIHWLMFPEYSSMAISYPSIDYSSTDKYGVFKTHYK